MWFLWIVLLLTTEPPAFDFCENYRAGRIQTFVNPGCDSTGHDIDLRAATERLPTL